MLFAQQEHSSISDLIQSNFSLKCLRQMEVTFIEGKEACIQQQHDIRFGKKKVKIIKSSVCYLFFLF